MAPSSNRRSYKRCTCTSYNACTVRMPATLIPSGSGPRSTYDSRAVGELGASYLPARKMRVCKRPSCLLELVTSFFLWTRLPSRCLLRTCTRAPSCNTGLGQGGLVPYPLLLPLLSFAALFVAILLDLQWQDGWQRAESSWDSTGWASSSTGRASIWGSTECASSWESEVEQTAPCHHQKWSPTAGARRTNTLQGERRQIGRR